MAFVPKDPTANEPIGSFIVNIFDFALKGNVKYQAPGGGNGAAIVFEFEAADDIKEVVANAIGADVDLISIQASGSSGVAQILIGESS